MDSAEAAHEHEPAKEEIQVDLIVDAFQAEGIVVKTATRPDGTLDFLYQEGVILVRDAYLRDVAAFLREREEDRATGRLVATPGTVP